MNSGAGQRRTRAAVSAVNYMTETMELSGTVPVSV
jgi:hypothetical protein